MIEVTSGTKMTCQQNRFEEFLHLVEKHSTQEGANYSALEGFGTYKASAPQSKHPAVDIPAILVVGQGQKFCYVGKQTYEYRAGSVIVMFYPLPVETEIVVATPEKPFLVAGVAINLGRMAEILLRIDRIDGGTVKPTPTDLSGIFSIYLNDNF
jgi:hypothetical protein